MPQTSELRLSSSMPPAVVARGSDDVETCSAPGCIHTGKPKNFNSCKILLVIKINPVKSRENREHQPTFLHVYLYAYNY